jgi:hypothetical protein
MRFLLSLFIAIPAFGVTPVVVNWGATPDLNNTGQPLTTAMTMHIPLVRATQAGNTLIVFFRYSTGSGWSVTDGGTPLRGA